MALKSTPPKKKNQKVKKVKKQVKKVSERKCVRDWDTVQVILCK